MAQNTFIVDCDTCKAKVAASLTGRAERSGFDQEADEPWGERLSVGICPSCGRLIAGYSYQQGFEGYDSEYDEWSEHARIYPRPPKVFSSSRIPKILTTSLTEADASMKAGAYTAACVMFGRALEALCRDVLANDAAKAGAAAPTANAAAKPLMLGKGIKALRDKKIIDDRLYEWSAQLQAFRNLAAHPGDEIAIRRDDAEDLQAFVHAIVEYVYDLAEKYEEFKARADAREKKKIKKP